MHICPTALECIAVTGSHKLEKLPPHPDRNYVYSVGSMFVI